MVQLNDFNYPRMALYLSEKYRKEAMCEAHDSIFGGHNATQKTYIKISTSFYWSEMFSPLKNTKISATVANNRKSLKQENTAFTTSNPRKTEHLDLHRIRSKVTNNLHQTHKLRITWLKFAKAQPSWIDSISKQVFTFHY